MEASHRQIVEEAYEALARGDMEGFLAGLHDEVEWHWPKGMADTDVFRGKDEVLRGQAVWEELWADFRMSLVEVLEHESDVLAVLHYSGRGRVSGVPMDEDVAHLWEFEGGRARRMRMFGDVERVRQRFARE